ncbi:AAA family ATPase [Rhizobium sp. Root73]|uniref:ATP-binding protein n=1 Tax=unclassified Rhizobium TaxID=2613769 RepID=UPI000723F02E|nr:MULTISPECIES: ATP-binding protein [unclassified Rhizobium]KQY16820.1 AAA family ATPase [Rhizobium sp. Root1334]KRC11377.1 AAA family ATPase [Rhizobium sp. Root73]
MNTAPSSRPLFRRYAESKVEAALEDTRVVMIVGPRQAGKTTLARRFVTTERPYLTLDDEATLDRARRDPVEFIRSANSGVIDEIQRAPNLMLAIKQSVDNDPRPGRFLLTGSANVMALPNVGDSLAGRIEIITLLPLAQAEISGSPGRLIDRLFEGEGPVVEAPPVIGESLVEAILKGGYPEALRRTDPNRRRAWHEDYLALVLDRDVRDIANLEQLDKLPRLTRLLSEQVGQLVNHQAVATALGLSIPTVQKYVAVLDRLFLVRSLPPWFTNRLSRLIKSPKLHMLDSGLLATLRDADAEAIRSDRTRLGPLLECFVVGEVLKLLTWSERYVIPSHFRTREQDEVDLVLEDRRGRIVGIEVKSAATLRSKDFSGLKKLQEAAGDKFVQGVLLHDHDRVTPFSEKIRAAPASILWQM